MKISGVPNVFKTHCCKQFLVAASYVFVNRIVEWLPNYTFIFIQFLTPQSCLHFQVFRILRLLNDCLIVWPSKLYLRGMQWFLKFTTGIYNHWFLNFPNNVFEKAEFLCNFGIYSCFTFLTQKKLHFSLICSFHCCLVTVSWALKVA